MRQISETKHPSGNLIELMNICTLHLTSYSTTFLYCNKGRNTRDRYEEKETANNT